MDIEQLYDRDKLNKYFKMMENYEMEVLDETRTRKTLSLFGFILVDGFKNDFVWTGKWFKRVVIKEQKIKERYADFDDGWKYQWFWKEWKEDWKFVEIVK
jgi:hypothetical protein